MKKLACLFVLTWSLAGFATTTDRFVLLLEFLPQLTSQVKEAQIEYHEGELTLLRLPDSEIEGWASRVHETLHACGGFLDVTQGILDGKTPQRIVWEEQEKITRIKPYFKQTVRERAEVAELVALANPDLLWNFLTELSAHPDRSATSDTGTVAADFLKNRAQALGASLPGFKTWTVKTGTYPKQPSVIATLPGTDPSLPHVVIGGHMDTYSNAKPGADDDGSGSATVMEIFRAISASKKSFRHTIDFIWYAAEERGLVGSSYVVDHFQQNRIPVKAVIQFDMTGFKSPDDAADFYLITDHTNAGLNQTIRQLITTYLPGLKIGETECGYSCSDHANWDRNGIPATFPFEASFDNMNHRLHTGNDKMDFLSKAHTANFARLGLAFAGELAEVLP